MNSITLFLLAMVAIGLACTAFKLIFGILMNFQHGLRLKQSLEVRINRLPLSDLLKKLGINKKQYLHHHVIHEIDEQIRNCENCIQKTECVSNLNSRSGKIEKLLSFCPNKLNFFEYKYTRNNFNYS